MIIFPSHTHDFRDTPAGVGEQFVTDSWLTLAKHPYGSQ